MRYKIRNAWWWICRRVRIVFGYATSEDYSIVIIESAQHLQLSDLKQMADYFKTLHEMEVKDNAKKNTN